MKVLETRHTSEGFIRRRRRDDNGVVYWTIEVPEKVWTHINKMGRANNRAQEFARTVHRAALKMRALEHMQEGWKAIASAHDLGLPVRTVQRWRESAQVQKHVREAGREQREA